jgi:hypothetical protein
MIYLFTSDGHRDSVDLSHYATTEQELIQIVQQFYEDIYWDWRITNIKVDFDKKEIIITFYDIDYSPMDTETHTTYFFAISKI